MLDRIDREMRLRAPVSKVWRALTDHRQFGAWFGARIEQPFEVGALCKAVMTLTGMEHLKWEMKIVKMEKERLFAFEWPPYINDQTDLANEPWQLVEFILEEIPEGTLLKMSESGFSKISVNFREDARRGNEGGWDVQMKNVANYAEKTE